MIFLMSQKKFVKNDKKLTKYRNYIIIDGEDAGSYDLDRVNGGSKDISTVYNNVVINGSFTPPGNILSKIKKELGKTMKDTPSFKDDESSSQFSWKLQNAIDGYLSDKGLIGGMVAAVKGQVSIPKDGNGQLNIFIVVPDRVYKYVGDLLLNRFQKLFKADFVFIVSQEELLADPKKWLKKDLSKKKLDYLDKRVEKLVKKYKLDKK